MAKVPDWQTQAIQKIQLQAFVLWVIALIACVVTVRLLSSPGDQRGDWGILIVLPMIFTIVLIIPMAYRRGVRDGRDHQADSQPDRSI
jgi:membrane protein YdbS with pleckstrin-like domain